MPAAHPDADIYPEATGKAAEYFSKHKSEEPLKLYSGWFCPFVQRALLVLYIKNIPYQYIEVNPYKKPQSLLSLNPRGLVPTLSVPVSEDGSQSKPLIESSVICEYLDEVYSDKSKYGSRLMPEDPYERARARIWIQFIGTNILPSFHRWLQFEGNEKQRGREEFLENVHKFTEQLHPEGPYWLGKELTMPDIIIAPWIIRLWVVDHFKANEGNWPGDADGEVWARWAKYVKAIQELDALKDTTSEKEYYLPIYKRYADNVAQSEAAKAIREGKHIP